MGTNPLKNITKRKFKLIFFVSLLQHVITRKNIMAKLVNNLASPSSPASIAALDKFRVVSFSLLGFFLVKANFIFIKKLSCILLIN
jgi:hypothetical protein